MIRPMSRAEFYEFSQEMSRLKSITWEGYSKTLQKVGISYLSGCNSSAKLRHNEVLNMLTSVLYLAPSDLCGINVCSHSTMCRESCLNGSGRARIDAQSHKYAIERARILKTRLFFANKEVFMRLLVHEISQTKKRAEKEGKLFSVRLNGTSDLSPMAFSLEGKNILEIFPNVQFYDYTKNPHTLSLMDKYDNYYLTFSRDGSYENEAECLKFLRKGGNVAVVFGVRKASDLPKTWKGYGVLCGDTYDYRKWDKLDPTKQIVGLIYKVTKNDFQEVNGRNRFKGIPNSPFIISPTDKDCGY